MKDIYEIKTIVKNRKQGICPICRENSFVFKQINEETMCLKCFRKKYPQLIKEKIEYKSDRRKPFKKLTNKQIESIRKNIKDYRKSIGKIKFLYGGCFN